MKTKLTAGFPVARILAGMKPYCGDFVIAFLAGLAVLAIDKIL